MPLNAASLQSDLEALFSQPPGTVAACADAWATAVGSYAAGIIPASTTVSSAKPALVSGLQGAFSSPAAGPGIDAAFLAFATTVAAGMLPLFTGIVPALPLNIASLFAAPQPTHAAAAAAFASKIDLWFRTGKATLTAPPNTPVPAWT